MLLAFMFTLSSLALCAAKAAMPEPELPQDRLQVPTFGDDTNVTLLARMLRDADPRVREQAVQGLGETHNPAALQYIEEAFSDTNLAVRCAVVSAVAQYPDSATAKNVIINALGETDPILLQAALTNVTRVNLKIASARVEELLTNDDSNIRLGALNTLNGFEVPVNADLLLKLLADPSAPIRLAATRNAILQSASEEMTLTLEKLAEATSPIPVQAGAIEALGKLAMDSSAQLIADAAESNSALLRRAAVRGFAHAGKIEAVDPFLKDPSPMVRLAAIQAAGDLKSKQIETLNSLMITAPDMQSHLAARKALVQIGTSDVAKLAAEAMPSNMEKYLKQASQNQATNRAKKPVTPDMARQEADFERNVISCCFILGELQSTQGFDYMLSLRKMVEIDSPIVEGLANATRKIGDGRAIAPLTELLKKCQTRGYQYLVAIASMSPPPPFSPTITSDIIEALGELKAYNAIDTIIGVAGINYMQMRLPEPACGAARAYQKLIQPNNRAKIEKSILEILNDSAFGLTTRNQAINTAAKLEIKSAVPAIKKILTSERPCLLVMQTAAWAIQELTGQTPNIPQPIIKQGAWVIKQIKD